VSETKRASQLLLEEQQQVTQGAQTMEVQFVQAQADLARSNAAKQKMQQDHRKLERRLAQIQEKLQNASRDLEQEQSEKLQWKRQAEELLAKEKIQQERLDRLEKELQESKTLLVDATCAAAETTLAKQEIQAALGRMEEANQQLHRQLQEQQQLLRKEKESHQQVLAQVQKDHQATQHTLSEQRDVLQSLKVEKQAADKKISQLQSKNANLERRLQDTTNLVAVPNTISETTTADDTGTTEKQSTNHVEFLIPRLGGDKENPTDSPNPSPPSSKCSICLKDASGLMRKCQCGREGCKCRAHAMCIQRITTQAGPSVSHPGTPAPRLPVVLCTASKSASMMASGTATDTNRLKSRTSFSAVAAFVAPVTPAATNGQTIDEDVDGSNN
jgi:DNA repair exonuclease SbcCD ATPase subunit